MTTPESIDAKLQEFKNDLLVYNPLEIIRKHIIYGSCAAITESQYFDLRSEIAEKYKLHPNEVLVVGSAKLGFSIAPHKQYRSFSDESDIDVVIVSSGLFDHIWKALFHFRENGGYWHREADFKNYLFQGWMRPDKLPSAHSFDLANEWWRFFSSLTGTGKYSRYKIVGALYRDWDFLESYQLRSVSACQQQKYLEGMENED